MLAASPTDAERTLTALAWRTPTQPSCPRLPLIAGRSREDFFYAQTRKKRPARERFFLCFNGPLRSSQNQAVLAAGLESAGAGGGIFSTTYVPSGPHTQTGVVALRPPRDPACGSEKSLLAESHKPTPVYHLSHRSTDMYSQIYVYIAKCFTYS